MFGIIFKGSPKYKCINKITCLKFNNLFSVLYCVQYTNNLYETFWAFYCTNIKVINQNKTHQCKINGYIGSLKN